MLRIERWKEAARYMDQLMKTSPDEQTIAGIVRATGLETWMAIENKTQEFSEEHRIFARKLIDAASAFGRNAATLNQALANLESDNLADRKRGVLALQSAGEAGLAAALQSVSRAEKVSPPILSEYLVTMKAAGEEALRAAIVHPDIEARMRLLHVVSRIPGGEFITELATGLFMESNNVEAKQALQRALSPRGEALPSVELVRRRCIEMANESLRDYDSRREEIDSMVTRVWRWSADAASLNADWDSSAGEALERAYQASRHLLALPGFNRQENSLARAIVLEREYRLKPAFSLESLAGERWFKEISMPDLNRLSLDLASAWDSSVRLNLYGAQLRILQSITTIKQKQPDFPIGSWKERFLNAFQQPIPAVRYQAAASAFALRGSMPEILEGKSFVRLKQEMKRLESRGLTLVIGGSNDRRDVLATQLEQIGLRAEQTGSARETLQFIQTAQPLEMIFIADRVLEMRLSELVQRIQTYPTTSSIPIILMTDSREPWASGLLESPEFAGRITTAVLSKSIDSTTDAIRRAQLRTALPNLDPVDRAALRAIVDLQP
jgi:CheY-like chemotaxis protein